MFNNQSVIKMAIQPELQDNSTIIKPYTLSTQIQLSNFEQENPGGLLSLCHRVTKAAGLDYSDGNISDLINVDEEAIFDGKNLLMEKFYNVTNHCETLSQALPLINAPKILQIFDELPIELQDAIQRKTNLHLHEKNLPSFETLRNHEIEYYTLGVAIQECMRNNAALTIFHKLPIELQDTIRRETNRYLHENNLPSFETVRHHKIEHYILGVAIEECMKNNAALKEALSHVKELNLSNSNLEGLPTNFFKIFSGLVVLDLSGNPISKLSENSFPSSLIELNLSDCNIRELESRWLPENLKSLDLSNNPISQLSLAKFPYSLRELGLSFIKEINFKTTDGYFLPANLSEISLPDRFTINKEAISRRQIRFQVLIKQKRPLLIKNKTGSVMHNISLSGTRENMENIFKKKLQLFGPDIRKKIYNHYCQLNYKSDINDGNQDFLSAEKYFLAKPKLAQLAFQRGHNEEDFKEDVDNLEKYYGTKALDILDDYIYQLLIGDESWNYLSGECNDNKSFGSDHRFDNNFALENAISLTELRFALDNNKFLEATEIIDDLIERNHLGFERNVPGNLGFEDLKMNTLISHVFDDLSNANGNEFREKMEEEIFKIQIEEKGLDSVDPLYGQKNLLSSYSDWIRAYQKTSQELTQTQRQEDLFPA